MPRKSKKRVSIPEGFRIVLASRSPRRRALLVRVIDQKKFIVRRSAVPESPIAGENVIRYCMRVALAKASRVTASESRSRNGRRRNLIVIAADTVISFRNKIIGQPKSRRDAVRILKLLSGKRHDVVTGLAVVLRRRSTNTRGKKNDIIITKAVISRVWLRRLSDRTIHDYVRTGEPMDKAGAYAIQEKGRRLVRKYSGSYTNIVGLPMEELRAMLQKCTLLRSGRANNKQRSGRANNKQRSGRANNKQRSGRACSAEKVRNIL